MVRVKVGFLNSMPLHVIKPIQFRDPKEEHRKK
jgi:hypothetical protein